MIDDPGHFTVVLDQSFDLNGSDFTPLLTQVKAANAGALPRYFGFGRGLSVLTSVTDHYATFGTKVIPASARFSTAIP